MSRAVSQRISAGVRLDPVLVDALRNAVSGAQAAGFGVTMESALDYGMRQAVIRLERRCNAGDRFAKRKGPLKAAKARAKQ